MHLDWLQINKVRNLSDIKLEVRPRLNLFTGKNASGKTAILESIYLLARAKSFRTPRIQEVVTEGGESLQISAGVTRAQAGKATVGVEKGRGRILLRNNGTTVKTVSEQARKFPIVLINPDTHLLVTGTPKMRRHWLDWAMFHVEQNYLENWRSYIKALRHRNALLKAGERKAETFYGWEQTMATTAAKLSEMRWGFTQKLQEIVNLLLNKEFNGGFDIKLYAGTGKEESNFREYLEKERVNDQLHGFTRYGPHRADLEFSYLGEKVAARFSRGQIKLFVSMLVLAEARVIAENTGENPVVLIDDYATELDNNASEYLLTSLYESLFQVFAATINQKEKQPAFHETARFHVEHGKVQKVVK